MIVEAGDILIGERKRERGNEVTRMREKGRS